MESQRKVEKNGVPAPYRQLEKKQNFTLIELLIVIAIIAILAGMLLPVLNRARDSARTTDCLSKVKQLSHTTLIYVSDYDDNLFARCYQENSNTIWPWPAVLISGLYAKGVGFICPTAGPRVLSGPTWSSDIQKQWRSVADDETQLKTKSKPYDYGSYGYTGWPDIGDPASRSHKITRYKNTSSKFLFGDAYDKANLAVGRYIGTSYLAYKDNRTDPNFSLIHSSNHASNVSYLDGHCVTFRFINPIMPYVQLKQSDFDMK